MRLRQYRRGFSLLINEGRDLDDEAGFGLCGFGDGRGGRGFESWLGFDDGELDGLRQLDAHGLAS